MNHIRKDHELPEATKAWGWKFHHIGIPTREKMPGETYLPQLKFFVTGFETSPFGIEWMRFEDDSAVLPLIRNVPHIAFEVTDLDAELKRGAFNVITWPNSPAEGIRVAMIEHNGAPVELIEFTGKSGKSLP